MSNFSAILGYLTPHDVPGVRMERWGSDADGGYAVPAELLKKANVLLTGGVANDVRFEAEVAEKVPGIRIGLFDHTIKAAPDHAPKQAKWHQLGLGPKDGGWLVTLPTARKLSGYNPGDQLVVKLDIENWEWTLIEDTPEDFWKDVSVLIIEFHSLGHRKDWRLYRSVLKKLDKYLIPIHMHGNNYARMAEKIGIRIPEVMEVTYINRQYIPSGVTPKPWTHTSPTPLDQPNEAGHEDPVVDYWLQSGSLPSRTVRIVVWWLKKCRRWVKKKIGV